MWTGTFIVLGIVVLLAVGVYFAPRWRASLRQKRDNLRVFSANELRHYADDIDVKK